MPRAAATTRARRTGARPRHRLARLERLVDLATTPALLVTDDGTVVRVSDAFAELVGTTADDLAGAPVEVLGTAAATLLHAGELVLRTTWGEPVHVRVDDLPHLERRAPARLLQVVDLRPVEHAERVRAAEQHRHLIADGAARTRRREQLNCFAREVLAAPDPAWVLDRAAVVLRDLLDVPLSVVLAVDLADEEDRPSLHVVAQRGWSAGFSLQTFGLGDRTHVGWALEHGTTVSTPAAETRFGTHRSLAAAEVLTGVATPVPSWGSRSPSAVLAAYATTARAITADDVVDLELLATVVAPAVERRRLQAGSAHSATARGSRAG